MSAIVLHTDAQPVDTPDSAVVGSWSSNASCVAISPNYIITTRHQGGDVGTIVKFNGVSYKVAEIIPDSSVDLRVARIDTLSGQPANLTNYVDIYTDSTKDINMGLVTIGGYGKGRGNNLSTATGYFYGYTWSNTCNTTLRWGTNYIDSTYVAQAVKTNYGQFTSSVLHADFDAPGVGNATEYEAAMAEYDSGGGWFVKDSDGEWKLVGLNAYVSRLNESWFDNPNTTVKNPDGDSLDAIRISTYATWIEANIENWVVLPGDANRDGCIDVSDLGILSENYGLSGKKWDDGDFNGDGVVDISDLGILASQYQYNYATASGTCVSVGSSSLSVPEPGTLLFLLLAGAGLYFNRRLKK